MDELPTAGFEWRMISGKTTAMASEEIKKVELGHCALMVPGHQWVLDVKFRPLNSPKQSYSKMAWESLSKFCPEAKLEINHNCVTVTLPPRQENLEIAVFGKPEEKDMKRMQMAIFGRKPTQGRNWLIHIELYDDTNVAFQQVRKKEGERGNKLLTARSGLFVSNIDDDIKIELGAMQPGWQIKGDKTKTIKYRDVWSNPENATEFPCCNFEICHVDKTKQSFECKVTASHGGDTAEAELMAFFEQEIGTNGKESDLRRARADDEITFILTGKFLNEHYIAERTSEEIGTNGKESDLRRARADDEITFILTGKLLNEHYIAERTSEKRNKLRKLIKKGFTLALVGLLVICSAVSLLLVISVPRAVKPESAREVQNTTKFMERIQGKDGDSCPYQENGNKSQTQAKLPKSEWLGIWLAAQVAYLFSPLLCQFIPTRLARDHVDCCDEYDTGACCDKPGESERGSAVFRERRVSYILPFVFYIASGSTSRVLSCIVLNGIQNGSAVFRERRVSYILPFVCSIVSMSTSCLLLFILVSGSQKEWLGIVFAFVKVLFHVWTTSVFIWMPSAMDDVDVCDEYDTECVSSWRKNRVDPFVQTGSAVFRKRLASYRPGLGSAVFRERRVSYRPGLVLFIVLALTSCVLPCIVLNGIQNVMAQTTTSASATKCKVQKTEYHNQLTPILLTEAQDKKEVYSKILSGHVFDFKEWHRKGDDIYTSGNYTDEKISANYGPQPRGSVDGLPICHEVKTFQRETFVFLDDNGGTLFKSISLNIKQNK